MRDEGEVNNGSWTSQDASGDFQDLHAETQRVLGQGLLTWDLAVEPGLGWGCEPWEVPVPG